MKWTCAFVFFLAACGGSHGAAPGGGDDDGGGNPDGGIGPGADGGGGGGGSTDGGGGGGGGTSTTEGLPCTPHTFACGSDDDVEVCNNAGTAWLYDHSCTAGCSDGVCSDLTCTPGATRCDGVAVQTCSSDGTTWTTTQTCSTFCEMGECALDGLTLGSNSGYSGTVIVAGDVDIGGGSTLTATSGDLTIIANNITIEAGASIAVAPTSSSTIGQSCGDTTYYCWYNEYYGEECEQDYVSVANYGESPSGYMVSTVGGNNESSIEGGGNGGAAGYSGCDAGANAISTFGGGTLRLIASGDITIAGQLLAPGEPAQGTDPSGGAGGGIELAANTIEVTGAISTTGGSTAGYGRVRLLYGTSLTNTGTIIGDLTSGRRPPIDLTSPTQPNTALVYNDDFTAASVTFERPFSTAQGYMFTVDQTAVDAVPTGADGTFTSVESFSIPNSKLVSGTNYVHVIPVDSSSALGTVETTFPIAINTTPPAASSSSHPSSTTWYDDANPFFAWSYPVGPASVGRVHYVFDHYANTIPTTADTALPSSQTNLLVSGVADGIWVLHVIAEDSVGNLTKVASHVIVRVGTDPGTGTVFGSVFDENDQPVSGATVLVNRGIFSGATAANGSYSISGVSAGTWEISVVYSAHHVAPQTVSVGSGASASASFDLIHD